MSDRLVCAVDLSETSRGAVCAAVSVAEALGSRIVLVHVAEPDGRSEDEAIGEAARALERSLSGLPLPDSAVRRIELGDPAECVVAAAADEDAALILTGTRHRGPRARALFGSVASRIVDLAEVPVLIAPESSCASAISGERPGTKEIVIGVDGRDHGLEAARIAAGLARRARAGIVLAHVMPPPSPAAIPPAGVTPPLDDPSPAVGERVLTEAREAIMDAGDVEFELRYGVAATELERLADERGSDLIVVGSSRPGRFRRLVLGSTAEALAGSSDHLLMIVPYAAHGAERPAGTARATVG